MRSPTLLRWKIACPRVKQSQVYWMFSAAVLQGRQLSCPFFGITPKQAQRNNNICRGPTRMAVLERWITLGLSRSFTLSSDPLEAKWGRGTNALLAPLVFKTLRAAVDSGQGSGTEQEEHWIQAKLLGTCEWLGHPIWHKQRLKLFMGSKTALY